MGPARPCSPWCPTSPSWASRSSRVRADAPHRLGALPTPYRVLYAWSPGSAPSDTGPSSCTWIRLALLAGAGAARLLAGMSRPGGGGGARRPQRCLRSRSCAISRGGPALDAALPEAYRWRARRRRRRWRSACQWGLGQRRCVRASSPPHGQRLVELEPPRYRDLVAAMEAFPDARDASPRTRGGNARVLVAGLPTPTGRRGWPGRQRPQPERVPDACRLRVSGPHRRGPSTSGWKPGWTVLAVRRTSERRSDWCRSTSAFLAPTGSGDARAGGGVAPLDLAPGAEHVECLGSGGQTGCLGSSRGATGAPVHRAAGQPARCMRSTDR